MNSIRIIAFVIAACAAFCASTADAKKPHLPLKHQVTPVTDQQVDEEEQMTFLEKAMDSARDFSPFTLKPLIDPSQFVGNVLAGKMVDYAAKFLGTRYRFGATGPNAFDCSGFMGWIYRKFGMNLERTSRSQYTQGKRVELDELQPGDLLFFSSRSSGRRNVGHVGMVVSVDKANGTCEFIHASTRKGVTYQSFPDNAYYSRHYIGVRRMLGTSVSAGITLDDAAI